MAAHLSDSQPQSQGLSSHLPAGGLVGIAWCSVALAGAFIMARTRIRLTRIGRLGYEDYWIYFAFVIKLINAILQTLQTRHLYYLDRANAGLEPSGATLLWHGDQYIKYEFCIIGLFWTTLWSIKASWLTLYWKLFDRLKVYQRWLKVVVVFVCLSYAGCWIAISMNCHPPSAYFHFGQCEKVGDLRGSVILIACSTAADTVTDLMIILLPLAMLYRAHFALKQKLALAAVFSLATIIICVAIARAVESSSRTHKDGVMFALWGIVESTISIIVGCLPPFYSLLRDRNISTRRNTPTNADNYTFSTFMWGTRLSSEANSSANPTWTSLAQLTREDSEINRLLADARRLEELVTRGYTGYPIPYLNISRQRSDANMF